MLDPFEQTWRVSFAPLVWFQQLQEATVNYVGSATFTPGPAGSRSQSSSGWTHYAYAEEDRVQGEKFISTRYHPGGFNPILFVPAYEFIGVAATNLHPATLYSGQTGADVPPPETAVGIWKLTVTLSWTLREKLPEVELIVRSPNYLEWRPTTQPGPTPGTTLRLKATLESPSGEDLSRISQRPHRFGPPNRHRLQTRNPLLHRFDRTLRLGWLVHLDR